MKKKHTSHEPQNDWSRVDSMSDEDIDYSDIPEVTPELFAKTILRKGLKPVIRKSQITVRIDEDVFAMI